VPPGWSGVGTTRASVRDRRHIGPDHDRQRQRSYQHSNDPPAVTVTAERATDIFNVNIATCRKLLCHRRRARQVVAGDFTATATRPCRNQQQLCDPNPVTSLGVLLGNGDGTFAPPVTYAVGRFPRGIVGWGFHRQRQARPCGTDISGGTVGVYLATATARSSPTSPTRRGRRAVRRGTRRFQPRRNTRLAVVNSGETMLASCSQRQRHPSNLRRPFATAMFPGGWRSATQRRQRTGSRRWRNGANSLSVLSATATAPSRLK